MSCLRTTGESQTRFIDSLLDLTIDEQENGEQTINVKNTDETEEASHRVTENQLLDAPLMKKELLLEQKPYENYRTTTIHVRQPNTEFYIDNQGILVRCWSVIRAAPTVVPETPRASVLYLANHPK